MSKKQETKVPLGKPLPTTPEELDLLALITPDDIAAAQSIGRKRMSARGRALLNAQRAADSKDDANGSTGVA